MNQRTLFGRVTLFAMALSLALSGACSRGGDEAKSPQETKTPVPTNEEEPSPAGRITINAATASSGPDSAAFVFDHDLQKNWNSGAFAPGWIQLDLGEPVTISRVRLDTQQTPSGPTSHEILGGLTPDSLTSLGTLEGNTADAQWLELHVKAQARYVKIVTLKSPSWVGWREIEVYK
jgi:hypothetical protein